MLFVHFGEMWERCCGLHKIQKADEQTTEISVHAKEMRELQNLLFLIAVMIRQAYTAINIRTYITANTTPWSRIFMSTSATLAIYKIGTCRPAMFTMLYTYTEIYRYKVGYREHDNT